MSVDTHMKNKKTEGYEIVDVDDVELLVSPKLLDWAHTVAISRGRSYIGRKAIKVEVEHDHGPMCRH